MKPPLHPCFLVLILGLAPAWLGAQKLEVPDWAWPGTATHQQVPPPVDFHRPTKTWHAALGVFEGQSDVGGPLLPGSSSYDPSTQRYTLT